MSLIIHIIVKLIEKNRLIHIINIPANAWIICNKHWAAHHKLIKRNFAKRNISYPAADSGFKIVNITRKFRVNIENKTSICIFKNLIKPWALKKWRILIIIITCQELIIAYLFKPRAPSRHKENELFLITLLIFKHIPPCKTCNRCCFFIISKLIYCNFLLNPTGCNKIFHRACTLFTKQLMNLLKCSYTVLEEKFLFLPDSTLYKTWLRSPSVKVWFWITWYANSHWHNIKHMLYTHKINNILTVFFYIFIFVRTLINYIINILLFFFIKIFHTILEEIITVILCHFAEFFINYPNLFVA